MENLDCTIVYRILQQLDPDTRLTASEVCRRWYRIASGPWTDIATLSLERISPEKIIPIIRRCPHLSELTGLALNIPAKLLQKAIETVGPELRSLKFYNCKQLDDDMRQCFNITSLIPWQQSDSFDSTRCRQLISFVWHCDLVSMLANARLDFEPPPGNNLARLQLSGKSVEIHWQELRSAFTRLTNLESLVLANDIVLDTVNSPSTAEVAEMLKPLSNMKDACFAFMGQPEDDEACFLEAIALAASSSWPKLELLWISSMLTISLAGVKSCITLIKTLRVLILADCLLSLNEPKPRSQINSATSQRNVRVFCSHILFPAVSRLRLEANVYALSKHDLLLKFLERRENAELVQHYWTVQMVREAAHNNRQIGTFSLTKDL